MPTFPSASLILFAESGRTDQLIWHAVQELGKNQWRTEVLIVSDDNADTLTERITYRPIPNRYTSVGQAIRAAKHDLIAIADPGFEFDAAQWQLMAGRIDRSPIQATFTDVVSKSQRPKRFCRALLWIYVLLVRVLLRTGKNEFDRGLTLFSRSELLPLLDEQQANTTPNTTSKHDTFFTPQLLSLARLNRRPVLETRIGHRNSDFEYRPRSSQVLGSVKNGLQFWWNKIMFPRNQIELPQKKFKPIEKVVWSVALMLIAAFVMLRCLSFPLFEPDEARNAQLALNVVNSGQWMSLTLAEDNYWDKPPLQIWAIAASYKLMGVSQFATRFPVVIAAMLTILLTLIVGQRLVGFRSAWLGSLLLLLTTGFVCTGRYVTMDSTLTAMTTATLLLSILALRGRFKKQYAVAAGIACGLGILAKGPIILILCVPPLLAAYWFSQPSGTRQKRQWLWFAVPALLIAAPWFIATAIVHPDFVSYFFWKHHIVRFSSAFNHREPFWYYFIGIFIFMFPASYLIPSLTKYLTSRKPENRLLRTREQGFLFLSAVWTIAFFSISESKLPTYIVPAFPPICLLMGVLLEQRIFSRGKRAVANKSADPVTQRTWLEKVGRRAPIELSCWFVLTGIAMFVFLKSESVSITWPVFAFGILVVASLSVVSIVYRRKPKIAWSCFCLIGLLLVTLTAQYLVPSFSTTRSIHLAIHNIRSSGEFENAPCVFFGRETYGAGLTLEESNIQWFDKTETISMIEFLTANPSAIIVSSEDPMETLRRDLPWTIELEERDDARHLYVSRPNPVVIANKIGSSDYR